MTPDNVYVVIVESRQYQDTLTPLCFFESEHEADMHCDKQNKKDPYFRYYYEGVANGMLLEGEL